MKRLALVILLLAAGCAEPSGPVSNVPRLTDALPAPVLRWGRCPAVAEGPSPATPGLRCADLRVPLDYRDPRGRQLTLKVSRLSTGDGRPVLVSNPGGPGAPGLFNTLGVDALTGGRLGKSDDLVGFDPRGIGLSEPVDCGLTPERAAAVSGGAAPKTFEADAAEAKDVAAACERAAGPVLPFLTTVNTARDLEMLRKALARDRISFVGTSYGTELALTYASMFPDGTGRVVLDSPVDPTSPPDQVRRESAAVADARFTEIAGRIAARDDVWHLGRTVAQVRQLYLATVDRLDRAPVVFDESTVDAAALQDQRLLPALQDDAQIEPLALALGFLARVPGALSAGELARRLGGGGTPISPEGQSPSQNVSAYYAYLCDDTSWPSDPGKNRRAFEDERTRFPVTRGQFAKITPCAFWPGPPRDPRPAVSADGWQGDPDILLLTDIRDYRAPAAGVRTLRAHLGGRARELAVDDYRHGVLGASSCATDRAVGWLVDGNLPGDDETC